MTADPWADVEAEDETPDHDVYDERSRMRMCAAECSTCIFRPGNLMHLRPGALRTLVGEARAANTVIVCHSTIAPLAPAGTAPAACRGFTDRYSTNAVRVMGRIGGIVEVEPPTIHLGEPNRG